MILSSKSPYQKGREREREGSVHGMQTNKGVLYLMLSFCFQKYIKKRFEGGFTFGCGEQGDMRRDKP